MIEGEKGVYVGKGVGRNINRRSSTRGRKNEGNIRDRVKVCGVERSGVLGEIRECTDSEKDGSRRADGFIQTH